MFLKAGSRSRRIKSILTALPNGDWALKDRVQVFVPPGTTYNRLSVALLVAKALGTKDGDITLNYLKHLNE